MVSSLEIVKQAIQILEGPGSPQERLANAYRMELQYLGAEALNEKMVYELELINDELTKEDAAGDQDAIDMSANAMTDREAQELMIKIRVLYEYLANHQK
jgi:hypothetical protein